MSNNIYIGNRYVPVFANPVEWDNLRQYEPLTIVTYNGTSYTSKKTVPVGTELSDTDYWAVTGNYNAQIEQYRQEVEELKTFVTPQMFGAKGDGVTDDTVAFQQAIDSGKVVRLISPSYLITNTINITNYVEICGNKERTVVNFTGDGFLFNISTDTITQPYIHDVSFTGLNNGLIFADRQNWGVSFILQNFIISGFHNEILHVNSGACITIENGRILSNGKIVFDTFDGTYNDNNFSNINYFKGVYYTGLTNPETVVILKNVNTMYFINCCFEKMGTVFTMTNGTKNVNFVNGWFELVDNIYNSTGEALLMHETNVALSKNYDANNMVFNVPTSVGKSLIYKEKGADTLSILFNNAEENIYSYMLYNTESTYSSTQYLCDITTHKAKFLQPLNTHASKKTGTVVGENLRNVINYSNVTAIFDTIIKVTYADYSTNWYKYKIYCSNGNSTIIEHELTYSQTWESATAKEGTETIAIVEDELKVTCVANATVEFIIQFSTVKFEN